MQVPVTGFQAAKVARVLPSAERAQLDDSVESGARGVHQAQVQPLREQKSLRIPRSDIDTNFLTPRVKPHARAQAEPRRGAVALEVSIYLKAPFVIIVRDQSVIGQDREHEHDNSEEHR